jgi:hypothetical protein
LIELNCWWLNSSNDIFSNSFSIVLKYTNKPIELNCWW